MSISQKQPFWYRFLRPLRDTPTPISTLVDGNPIPEIKIITENDLKIEHILMEEFRFRGECIKQVASDITSTFNLYFLLSWMESKPLWVRRTSPRNRSIKTANWALLSQIRTYWASCNQPSRLIGESQEMYDMIGNLAYL